MRTLLLIGIGAGDPDQLTVAAVDALNRAEVFFVFDKDQATELTEARAAILRRHVRGTPRLTLVPEPDRDRRAADYAGAVGSWRDARADRLAEALRTELGPDGTGALLVWGDPALYDGTIRIAERLRARADPELDYRVVPGISSVTLLTARHRVPLNQVAGSVLVTTGRRLARGVPAEVDDVVVMLDPVAGGELACAGLRGQGWHIYWGAYLGGPDEALVAGPLDQVLEEITARRAALRARKGWIMDTYLLRRLPRAAPPAVAPPAHPASGAASDATPEVVSDAAVSRPA